MYIVKLLLKEMIQDNTNITTAILLETSVQNVGVHVFHLKFSGVVGEYWVKTQRAYQSDIKLYSVNTKKMICYTPRQKVTDSYREQLSK